MWLLDVNLPIALVDVLEGIGIQAKTTESQGWRTLENGKLVAAAFGAGFTVILTRDTEFGLSAAKALKEFPRMSVVIVTLPQHREKIFIAQFMEAWKKTPILAIPGGTRFWPEKKKQ